MRKVRRVLLLAVAVMLAGVAPAVAAKDSAKEKDKKASGGGKSLPPGKSLNVCGCYKNDQGGCVCTDRKAKCECPGDCEPVGCEEKRQKEIEKEYAAEVKRAQEEDKKRRAAEEAAESGGAQDGQDKGADKGAPKGAEKTDEPDKPAASEPAAPAKPAKPKRKEPPAEKK